MDIVDRAQDTEQQARDTAIAMARAGIAGGPGRNTCLACGEEIPRARRRALPGAKYCVGCQAEMEKRP